MSSDGLPPNWFAYKTETGEEYFYNTVTQETTWDKPRQNLPPPMPASMPPALPAARPAVAAARPAAAAGGGRGDLLSAIQGGARLKKVDTVDKSIAPGAGTVGGAPPSGGAARSPAAAAPAPAGVHAQLASMLGGGGAAPKGGGFAEIMRKNKEAAAKKAGAGAPAPAPAPSPAASGPPRSMPPSVPVNRQESPTRPALPTGNSFRAGSVSSGGGSVEDRLASIEQKLDAIMRHLNI